MPRGGLASDRKAGSTAAGCRRLRIVDPKRRANQIVDEIDLGAGQIAHRRLIDQDGRRAALNDEIIGSLGAIHVELVLEARATAALDAHAKHRADRLTAQNLANSLRCPLGDRNAVHR